MFPLSEKTSMGVGVETSTASLAHSNGTSTPNLMFQQPNGSHTDRKTTGEINIGYRF